MSFEESAFPDEVVFEDAQCKEEENAVRVSSKKKKVRELPEGCPPNDYKRPPQRPYFNKVREYERLNKGKMSHKELVKSCAIASFLSANPGRTADSVTEEEYDVKPHNEHYKNTEDWLAMESITFNIDLASSTARKEFWAAHPEEEQKKIKYEEFMKAYRKLHPKPKEKYKAENDSTYECSEELRKKFSARDFKLFGVFLGMQKKIRVAHDEMTAANHTFRSKCEDIVEQAGAMLVDSGMNPS